jgi:hypothetical protein
MGVPVLNYLTYFEPFFGVLSAIRCLAACGTVFENGHLPDSRFFHKAQLGILATIIAPESLLAIARCPEKYLKEFNSLMGENVS